MIDRKLQIGVIIGGKSVEHDISLISGSQVNVALDKTKYESIMIYIDRKNHLYICDAFNHIETFKDNLLDEIDLKSYEIALINDSNHVYYYYLKKPKKRYPIDVFIPCVHGYGIEDGTISAYLEMYEAIYTCSETIPSAIIQDKAIAKLLLKDNKIEVLDSITLLKNEELNLVRINQLGYPVIIKPTYLGSSIGIKIVKDEIELEQALEQAFQYCDKVLIEKALTNFVEYNCASVSFKNEVILSSIEKVDHLDEILSFKNKYEESEGKLSNNVLRVINPKLPKKLKEEIKETTSKIYKLFQLSGVVRIDYIYDKETDNLYVNEINNIPGSLAYYLFIDQDISFSKLLDILISEAIIKKHHKEQKKTNFVSNVFKSKSLKLKK